MAWYARLLVVMEDSVFPSINHRLVRELPYRFAFYLGFYKADESIITNIEAKSKDKTFIIKGPFLSVG